MIRFTGRYKKCNKKHVLTYEVFCENAVIIIETRLGCPNSAWCRILNKKPFEYFVHGQWILVVIEDDYACNYFIESETLTQESDIYNRLTAKNSREICHFTIFESNRIQWNKVMNFQEPAIKIFCPDLYALRDTFRTVVTVRLVYSVVGMRMVRLRYLWNGVKWIKIYQ